MTIEALHWMRSRINGRTQSVSLGTETSADAHLCRGVPQRSVLGLKLYCMYTKPIGDIVKEHNLHYYCNAYNTQIYFFIKPDENWDDVSVATEAYLADVCAWMSRNIPQLNSEKIIWLYYHLNTSHTR